MKDKDRTPQVGLSTNAPSVSPMKMGPVNSQRTVSQPSTAPKGGDRKSKQLPGE
jgi:hypothetical protein